MKIIRNNFIPVKGFKAINLFGVLFVRGNAVISEKTLRHEHIHALGSDFDGATLPTYLNTPAKAAALYEYFLEKGMSKELAEGIMFRNAEEFFRKNL